MLQHYVIYRASNRLIASQQTIEDEEEGDGVAADECSRLLDSWKNVCVVYVVYS